MKQKIKFIDISKIKSKWHKNVLKDWQPPDPGYIDYLIERIKKKQYTAPIVLVKESDGYYIVNGHHRLYASLKAGVQKMKCIIIEGNFADSEPLRKAEVLLKEFDIKTEYRYQLSGYLDRWAAAAEEYQFINKYRPTYKFRLYKFLKKMFRI